MARRYGSAYNPSDSAHSQDSFAKRELVVARCKLLNVRSEPIRGNNILFAVTEGTRLTRLDDVGLEWVHVQTTDPKPREGYVMRKFVEEI